jgi:hypothetical protein
MDGSGHQPLGDRAVRRQRQRIEIDVGSQGVRRKPRDHHLGGRIDVDHLTVNAARAV